MRRYKKRSRATRDYVPKWKSAVALNYACVLGAGGFLGSRTVDHLRRNPKFRITAITSSQPSERILLADNNDRITWVQIKSIDRYFSDEILTCILRHDLIFYFLASSRSESETRPELARLINIELPALLMDKLESNNTLIHFSSFGVFEKIMVIENQLRCKVNPADTYSRQKLEAERIITNTSTKSKLNAFSIRLPNMVGFPTKDLRLENRLFFYQIVQAAKSGHRITIQSDELKVFCPVIALLVFFESFPWCNSNPRLINFNFGIPFTPTQFAKYVNDILQPSRGKNCVVSSDYKSEYSISPIRNESGDLPDIFHNSENIEKWLRFEILTLFDDIQIKNT